MRRGNRFYACRELSGRVSWSGVIGPRLPLPAPLELTCPPFHTVRPPCCVCDFGRPYIPLFSKSGYFFWVLLCLCLVVGGAYLLRAVVCLVWYSCCAVWVAHEHVCGACSHKLGGGGRRSVLVCYSAQSCLLLRSHVGLFGSILLLRQGTLLCCGFNVCCMPASTHPRGGASVGRAIIATLQSHCIRWLLLGWDTDVCSFVACTSLRYICEREGMISTDLLIGSRTF